MTDVENAAPEDVAETANTLPETPPEPPYKALLDENGVLTGYGRTDGPGIEVPEDCDLPAGRYKWDGEKFVPILEAFKKTEVDHPDTVMAIALGLEAYRDAKPLPEITLKWLEEFRKTIDGGA